MCVTNSHMTIFGKILSLIGIKPWPEDGYYYFRFNGWKDASLPIKYKTVDLYEQFLSNPRRNGGRGHSPGIIMFRTIQDDTDFGTPLGALIEVVARTEIIHAAQVETYLNERGIDVSLVEMSAAKAEIAQWRQARRK